MADPGEKKKRATYQDVLDAPEHMVAEIIGGELRLSPRPKAPHTIVATELGYSLGPPFHRGHGGPGGWTILDEPELHLGPDIVVPDLAGWRRERMPGVREEEAYHTLPPDWVCEVLSKSTEIMDRADKLEIYAGAGVGHAWLVHPLHRSLEVFRLERGRWSLLRTYVGDQRVRAEPFDAIELDLALLWAGIVPRTPPSRASEPGAAYAYDDE